MNGRRPYDHLDPDVVRRIVEHETARRELLWLRAREKRDLASIRSLQRADAELAVRMRAYERSALQVEDPDARVDAFRELHDETFAHWASVLMGDTDPCFCRRCAKGVGNGSPA